MLGRAAPRPPLRAAPSSALCRPLRHRHRHRQPHRHRPPAGGAPAAGHGALRSLMAPASSPHGHQPRPLVVGAPPPPRLCGLVPSPGHLPKCPKGKSPLGKAAGSAGIVIRTRCCCRVLLGAEKAFWCAEFLEYLYGTRNLTALSPCCVRRLPVTQGSYEHAMLQLAEKSMLSADYS